MKKLTLVSIFLALLVIVLGAYTRLTDAGLGCPDWPGCYGHLIVPQAEHHIEAANEAYPDRPVEAHKAWNEMIHRYFAATLGFFILIIFITSFFKKFRNANTPFFLPLILFLMVCFQGALGMWTVTLNLLPIVVMGHLLGGFTVLTLLFLLYLRLTPYRIPGGDPQIRKFAKYSSIGIFLLVVQIGLGGWTSANYASLACTELPICEGEWASQLDVMGAFSIPAADNYEFGVHPYEERMTMHVFHRFGALVLIVYLSWLGVGILRKANSGLMKQLSWLMLFILSVQVGLGVSNVVYSLPLIVATLHNAVAACLLLVLVMMTYTIYRKY
ncbi:COX15/CtaA family protein [Glaciecola sp. 1036]|uniref:COX15/CtaA family protein n=1 Tax=Alteromonadaceae TaxID=72275 RepID=UPI003D012745